MKSSRGNIDVPELICRSPKRSNNICVISVSDCHILIRKPQRTATDPFVLLDLNPGKPEYKGKMDQACGNSSTNATSNGKFQRRTIAKVRPRTTRFNFGTN
jgi:hypothetical protein